MYFVLLFMVLFSAVPLAVTIFRWMKLRAIKRRGVKAEGRVIGKFTRAVKWGRAIDKLHIEYRDWAPGQSFRAEAFAPLGKFEVGDTVTVYYLPARPGKIVLAGGLGYGPMLLFFTGLFLFVLFAVYKLDEMIRTGAY
ncbi:DUF3592 domain-containing protein [Chitinophaga sp.]|uniref:DUF3592 domain-containing protein n=1 Tax=Chitinophaga sp. TaxID=1869181 RepID=UPI0026175FAD|nr:DUF3592 domain-containing protein [uncultured Chitinophaga sp.]